MKSRSVHNSTKKGLLLFLLWRYGLSWIATHPRYFPSSNITKNIETHPTPMRDVIIEDSVPKLKGTLIQIWKSANIFVFILKYLCWKFHIKAHFTFGDMPTWDM